MKVYVYIDGDGVGDKLEGYIVDNDLNRAAELSGKLNETLRHVQAVLRDEGAEVVFAGGDNIFVLMEYNRDLLQRILTTFLNWTGITATAGAGKTPADAYLAFMSAKAQGGGRIVVRNGAAPEEAVFALHSKEPVDRDAP